MRASSFLITVVLLIAGMLVVEAAVMGVPVKGQDTVKGQDPVLVNGQDPVKGQISVKGQDRVKGQGPVKGQASTKSGSCPKTLIRCAMLNPPNHCLKDTDCPGIRKCCEGSCGMACLDPQ
ncbi:elafin [Sapajus apella]|uniref:Elafin n=1 Tax=Sapajus apella TaxID=9515 RepID=A0A6J3GNY0_SAPAP|nr:elafin [Sapajus apella]